MAFRTVTVLLKHRIDAFRAEIDLTTFAHFGIPIDVRHANCAHEVVFYWIANRTIIWQQHVRNLDCVELCRTKVHDELVYHEVAPLVVHLVSLRLLRLGVLSNDIHLFSTIINYNFGF